MARRSLRDMRLEKLAREAAGIGADPDCADKALEELTHIATRSPVQEFRFRASQYLIEHREKFFQAGEELIDAVLELPRDEQYAEIMRSLGAGLISKADADFLLKMLGMRHNEKIQDLEAENRALRLALKLGKHPKEIELSRNQPDLDGDPSGDDPTAMIDVQPESEPMPMPTPAPGLARSQLGKVITLPKNPNTAA